MRFCSALCLALVGRSTCRPTRNLTEGPAHTRNEELPDNLRHLGKGDKFEMLLARRSQLHADVSAFD